MYRLTKQQKTTRKKQRIKTATAVRAARLEKGLSQEGLARQADVSVSMIQKIENGLWLTIPETVAKILDLEKTA